MAHYIVKGLGRGFDGLLVEGTLAPSPNALVEISKITNRNEIFGDRNVSYPVKPGTLFLSEDVLEEIDDPSKREYDAKNPWGRVLFEGRYTKGTLEIAYCQYERVLQVSVIEKVNNRHKTLFSGYYTEQTDAVRNDIEACLRSPDFDVDDLVFQLKAFKSED